MNHLHFTFFHSAFSFATPIKASKTLREPFLVLLIIDLQKIAPKIHMPSAFQQRSQQLPPIFSILTDPKFLAPLNTKDPVPPNP